MSVIAKYKLNLIVLIIVQQQFIQQCLNLSVSYFQWFCAKDIKLEALEMSTVDFVIDTGDGENGIPIYMEHE